MSWDVSQVSRCSAELCRGSRGPFQLTVGGWLQSSVSLRGVRRPGVLGLRSSLGGLGWSMEEALFKLRWKDEVGEQVRVEESQAEEG